MCEGKINPGPSGNGDAAQQESAMFLEVASNLIPLLGQNPHVLTGGSVYKPADPAGSHLNSHL